MKNHLEKVRQIGISFGITGEMSKQIQTKKTSYGDEAPTLKEFLAVILVVAVLIGFFWLGHHLLNWFH